MSRIRSFKIKVIKKNNAIILKKKVFLFWKKIGKKNCFLNEKKSLEWFMKEYINRDKFKVVKHYFLRKSENSILSEKYYLIRFGGDLERDCPYFN